MINKALTNKLTTLPTPYYFYDMKVLESTLSLIRSESERHGFKTLYAVKANFNPRIVRTVSAFGFGADCVSGNEIKHCLGNGFGADEIVYAGVGKTDSEIEYALRSGILCFNCESGEEIENIADIAGKMNVVASVALRINPNVDAFTHYYITTGVEESKFGIHENELENIVGFISDNPNLKLRGVHFHIGSQILNLTVFKSLCSKINELLRWFDNRGTEIDLINVGGGLGIDHYYPDTMPRIREYFEIFATLLERKDHQQVLFEMGRAAVGQCGSLITRVLYIKKVLSSTYAIVDAGMTDLLRPALYQAFHLIENLSSAGKPEKYNVVGPVCESADTFARMIDLPPTRRGDLLAIRSAGAYGEAMASRYNLRDLPPAVFSDDL